MKKELNRAGVVGEVMKMETGGYFGVAVLDKVQFADYQRDEIPDHVDKIGRSYDPASVRPLSLSLRKGILWAYDGRQTVAVLKEKGKKKADATIVTGKTYEQEAQLFFNQNDSPRKMAGWIKYKAAVAAGSVKHRSILEVVHNNKLWTPISPGIDKRDYADVTSTTVLLEAFKKGDLKLVDQVCQVISKCWRTKGLVNELAKRLDCLRGLTGFLKKYINTKPFAEVLRVLKGFTPEEIKGYADEEEVMGRVDAAQYTQAFDKLLTIAGRVPKKKAA